MKIHSFLLQWIIELLLLALSTAEQQNCCWQWTRTTYSNGVHRVKLWPKRFSREMKLCFVWGVGALLPHTVLPDKCTVFTLFWAESKDASEYLGAYWRHIQCVSIHIQCVSLHIQWISLRSQCMFSASWNLMNILFLFMRHTTYKKLQGPWNPICECVSSIFLLSISFFLFKP